MLGIAFLGALFYIITLRLVFSLLWPLAWSLVVTCFLLSLVEDLPKFLSLPLGILKHSPITACSSEISWARAFFFDCFSACKY